MNTLKKKIEAFEMKMASLTILIPPLVALVGTLVALRRRGRFGNRGVAQACRSGLLAGLGANRRLRPESLDHRVIGLAE